MSDTNSSAADAHSNMTQPVTATTRLPAPRTPAQYAAAQAHAAQVIQDARSLDLGFRIWPPGRFANFNTVKTQKSRNNENNENIALVSCHGNDSVGYNFSLHVSGATQFSEPGKETGNVLTFARELVKILQDKSEDIEKGARYAAKTLDGSLTQRERYPSDRQAAVKIATLLEGYYSDPTQSKGPADTWSFYGTEKNVLDLVTTSSSQPSQLPPNWPSTLSATPIDLHGTKSFRDREVFVERMLSTSDGPVKVMPFPVRWTGGSKPFTLMEGETVADRTENARLAEIKQQRMAERLAAEQGYGQSSTGSLSQDTTGRTLPFTKDDKRGPRRSSRNRPRMLPRKKAAEASTRQSHLSTHNPTTSAPQSIDNKDNLHYHFSEVSINYRQNSGNASPAYPYNSSDPSANASPGSSYFPGQPDLEAYDDGVEPVNLHDVMLSPEEQAIVDSMSGPGPTPVSRNLSVLNGFEYQQSAPGLPLSPAAWNLTNTPASDVPPIDQAWPYLGW